MDTIAVTGATGCVGGRVLAETRGPRFVHGHCRPETRSGNRFPDSLTWRIQCTSTSAECER